jgi:uncharacterized protein YbjT (DUF2867 family)
VRVARASIAQEVSLTVLVTGATGTTGSAVVERLLARGVGVRVMVRRETDVARFAALGADVAVADFDDASACAAALAGVGRVYLVTPSSEHAETQQSRFAELAAEAGVERLVTLSQLGADESSPVRFLQWHAAVERHIRELGVGYTFLRPNLFFQGVLAVAGTIASEGRFFAPIGDARVSAVDVRDIAAVAAAALTESGHDKKTYTITGPAAVTHDEIADALSIATGRSITFVDVPPMCSALHWTACCPPGSSTGSWRTTRTMRRARPLSCSRRSPRSPDRNPETSPASPATTRTTSPTVPASTTSVTRLVRRRWVIPRA